MKKEHDVVALMSQVASALATPSLSLGMLENLDSLVGSEFADRLPSENLCQGQSSGHNLLSKQSSGDGHVARLPSPVAPASKNPHGGAHNATLYASCALPYVM